MTYGVHQKCQFLWLYNTHDMLVNDEHGFYITNTNTLEFLWAISEHLKQTLEFDTLLFFKQKTSIS